MKKLTVNMISETTFTVRGHGVHTAFIEMTKGLSQHKDVDLKVNTFRRADITHIQTIGPYSLAALLWGRSKKVVSVHVIPDSFAGSLVGAKYWNFLSTAYLKWFYGRADLLMAVSLEVKDNLTNELHIRRPIEVVFNTVDSKLYHSTEAEKAAARAKLGLPAGRFTVVSVGQIQPRKRFDIFCELAKQLPEYSFIWVGGIPFKHLGAEHGKMMELINNKPDNLQITGVIELSDVRQYYLASNAFILASNQENHPLAVIEAAASGLPVVVRDIPEYNSSFGNDIVRGDDDTFKSLLQRLETDPEFRAEAIRKSAILANKFDNVQGSERLITLYRSLLRAD